MKLNEGYKNGKRVCPSCNDGTEMILKDNMFTCPKCGTKRIKHKIKAKVKYKMRAKY